MTARQKLAPVSATAPLANGSANGTDRSSPLAWEDWFQHAAPQQRALALGLAQQQGLLYAHQLPAVNNGKAPAHAADASASKLLSRLLASKAEGLPPLDAVTFTVFDTELDGVQRQAVRRALGTPDFFLLHGLPGTGKSRVLAEVIRQAAVRGWRVLFLGGQPASLDVVLERLAGKSEVLALRVLDAGEKPDALPAWLRAFTLDEQKKAFLERMQTGARGNRDRVEAACRRHIEQAPLWNDLTACTQRWADWQARRQKVQDQLAQVTQQVERAVEAGSNESPRVAQLAELRQANAQAVDERNKDLQAQRDALVKCQQETAQLAARIAEIEPAYLAKKNGRFWSVAYWSNLFNGQVVADMESLQKQRAEAQEREAAVAREIEQRVKQVDECAARFAQERAALVAAEVAAREEALQTQVRMLDDEKVQLEAEWSARCGSVDAGATEKTPEAVKAAHEAWLAHKARTEDECQFAHQWVAYLDESAPQWAARIGGFANVLAGSVGRWTADAKFRDLAAGPFDLLIVEDADALCEAELAKLAGVATRCVLVGSSVPPVKPSAGKQSAEPCWAQLWQALGGDACWPHAWRHENGRLVCQLTALSDDDRRHLESEWLADGPDIELVILHRPQTRPCLAQVTFGADYRFADAFTFMVREVQEFPLQPLGRTAWWHEDERQVCRHWGPNITRVHEWVEPEPGVRLGAVPDSAGAVTRIATVEFAKAAGWDRAKAHAWLQCRRSHEDHERIAFLQVPYRYQAPIARLASELVRSSDWLTHACAPTAHEVGITFVAVPESGKRDWPQEAAGLELDLSLPRSADKLPAGVRHGLPMRGYVNYPEAQALVRRLETGPDACRVAVLALYEAQAVLLRRLIEQSETLRGRRHPLDVALPSKLHQHEYDTVYLSLTRSRSQRVCCFGEDVRELPTALTRARSRLFVFGDPGALLKRIAHKGPFDRQDAHVAEQEHAHLSRLVACVRDHVPAAVPSNGATNGEHA